MKIRGTENIGVKEI